VVPVHPKRGATAGGRVYLTFDDGPDATWTPQILDALAAEGASATFFVVGREAQRRPALLRTIIAAGHEVANHGFAHRHPWTLSAAAGRREVRDGAAAIADATGLAPRFYRPAHGRLRRALAEAAAEGGQRVVGWSLSVLDWGPWASSGRIARRLGRAAPGDIVLMHDGRNRHNHPDRLLRCLPGALRQLRQRGFVPSRLSFGEC
jgi:peptidoglycan/xylan/chitin deacetylase (PgdA/CDA1 family)